jgi:hypothetical protein
VLVEAHDEWPVADKRYLSETTLADPRHPLDLNSPWDIDDTRGLNFCNPGVCQGDVDVLHDPEHDFEDLDRLVSHFRALGYLLKPSPVLTPSLPAST